jgi:hypothetical protein
MKIFFVCICVVFANALFGQIFKHSDSSFVDNKFCVKIPPLALIGSFSGSALRVDLEKKMLSHNALCFELGTFLPLTNRSLTNNRGVITRLEWKYYCSVEFFYKNQSYNTHDSIKSTPNYYNGYAVAKIVACLNIKYGYLDVYKKGFIMEVFVGVGVRVKDSNSTLSVIENNNIVPLGDVAGNIFANKSGRFIYPNVDVGFKIGFKAK